MPQEYNTVAPPASIQEDVTVVVPVEEPEEIPKGVSKETWERLKKLKKRKEEMSSQLKKTGKVGAPNSRPKVPRKPKQNKKNTNATENGAVTQIRQFMSPNPQLRDVPLGKLAVKSQGELEIEEALAKGEYDKAAMLSDKFQTHESATAVLQAISCVRYAEDKKVEDAQQRSKKMPRLDWTFDPKTRWERKGNM